MTNSRKCTWLRRSEQRRAEFGLGPGLDSQGETPQVERSPQLAGMSGGGGPFGDTCSQRG